MSLSTDRRLMAAAAELVDERGVDDVTVGEITARAGQRNGAAVHYHFGGRQGLLDALVVEHHELLDGERTAALSQLADSGREADVTDYVRILVEPLVARLDDARGRACLRIQAERSLRGEPVAVASSVGAIIDALDPLVPDTDDATRLERARLVGLLISIRLGQAAAEQPDASTSRSHLTDTLIDATAAILIGT